MSLVKLNPMSPNHLRFPALIVGYMYSLRDPIGSFEFVRALWLVRWRNVNTKILYKAFRTFGSFWRFGRFCHVLFLSFLFPLPTFILNVYSRNSWIKIDKIKTNDRQATHICWTMCLACVYGNIWFRRNLVAFKKATYHNTISVRLHFLKLPHYSTVLLPASPLSKEK